MTAYSILEKPCEVEKMVYQQKYEIVAHLKGLINSYQKFESIRKTGVIGDLEDLIEKIMPKEEKVI